MRTRLLFPVLAGLSVAACSTEPASDGSVTGPNFAVMIGSKTVLATGSLTWGTLTYPNAVLTYDQAMDDTDAGSNPGIELWTNNTLVRRLARSNDNNGQWDYTIAGAYFSGGVAYAFGTRTGSHGPQGRVWRSTGGGFLAQDAATYDCTADQVGGGFGGDRLQYGPFSLIRGLTTYPAAVVTYDRAMDLSDAGSNPGIEVWPTASLTGRLLRSNDNNGQWDYRVDCAYASSGVIRIVGARSANGGTSWNPFLWVTEAGGFLTGYAQ